MSKKYVIEDRYIPAHELSLKMRKKYPVLKAYYDGGVILLDSIGKDKGWTPEDFIIGLWMEAKDVPWDVGDKGLKVYEASCVFGSAVPRGEVYLWHNQVRFKPSNENERESSDNMELEEKRIDEFMALIEKGKHLKKQAMSKIKVKELNKDFV